MQGLGRIALPVSEGFALLHEPSHFHGSALRGRWQHPQVKRHPLQAHHLVWATLPAPPSNATVLGCSLAATRGEAELVAATV